MLGEVRMQVLVFRKFLFRRLELSRQFPLHAAHSSLAAIELNLE